MGRVENTLAGLSDVALGPLEHGQQLSFDEPSHKWTNTGGETRGSWRGQTQSDEQVTLWSIVPAARCAFLIAIRAVAVQGSGNAAFIHSSETYVFRPANGGGDLTLGTTFDNTQKHFLEKALTSAGALVDVIQPGNPGGPLVSVLVQGESDTPLAWHVTWDILEVKV